MTTTAPRKTGRKRGHGEGSITQRKSDGLWQAALTLPDGKRKYLYGKTRKDVQDKLARALHETRGGLPLPDNRQTLKAFLQKWLIEVARPKVRATTLTRYTFDVKRIGDSAIGRFPLAQVTPQAIQAFLNDLTAQGLSARSVQHSRAVLRSALTCAERWGLVPRNAARLVSPPRAQHHEAPAISPEQAGAILDAFEGHPFEALVTVALGTGLRKGELMGLRWDDVDLNAGTLTVRHQLQRINGKRELTEPKSRQSRRTIALAPSVVESLRLQRVRQLEMRLAAGARWQETNHVFTSAVGSGLDQSNVTHTFQAQLKRAGAPHMRFHDLRHGAASLLLTQGVSARAVMDVLGHSQITLTLGTYSHIINEVRRDAADKMEGVFERRRVANQTRAN